MRLIRDALGPAYLSSQFGGNAVLKTSIAWLAKVPFEISDVATEKDVQWRGYSVASVPYDTSETKKASRRVPKDVRKTMLENYVDNYRAMNAGRFPTPTDAQKNVGGSYYVVRKILQELKYDSFSSIGVQEVCREPVDDNTGKPSIDVLISGSDSRLEAETNIAKKSGLLSMDVDTSNSERETDSILCGVQTNGVFVNKKLDTEKPSTQAGEFLTNYASFNEPILKMESEDSSSKNIETKEGSQSLSSVESDKSEDAVTPSYYLFDKSAISNLESPESKIKEIASEDHLSVDELKSNYKQQNSTRQEIQERELHEVQASVEGHEKKSSMWQNLKSFASGVFGIWRRS